jgi:hypothetical protein
MAKIAMVIVTIVTYFSPIAAQAKEGIIKTNENKNCPNIYGNYPENINAGRSRLVLQGEWVYYGDQKGLFKVKRDGSSASQLSTDRADNINVVGDWVYYIRNKPIDKYYKLEMDSFDINVTYEDVYEFIKIKVDGTSKTLLDEGDTAVYEKNIMRCYVRDNVIFYMNSGGEVFRMDTEGQNKKKIIDNINGITGMYFDKDHIFYNDHQNNTYSINQDGSNPKKISQEGMWIVGISEQSIYYRKYSQETGGKVFLYKMSRLDSKISLVIKEGIGQVIVLGQYIYYIGEAGGSEALYRIKADGSHKTLIHTFHMNPSEPINIWDEYIYFRDYKSKASQEVEIFKIRNNDTKMEENLLNKSLYYNRF